MSTTLFIGGQTPKTLGETRKPETICRGWTERNGTHKSCPKSRFMEAKLGIVEPRCKDCYKKHMEAGRKGK